MKTFTLFFLLLSSISAFSTNVTFKVDISTKPDSIDASNGIFIVGDVTGWLFVQMDLEEGSVYSTTLTLNASDAVAYYFLATNSWDDYAQKRERLEEGCSNSAEIKNDPAWTGDRAFVVPENDTTIALYWGSCQVIGTTGISDINSNELSMNIYPNPVSNTIFVELPTLESAATVDIITMQGSLVKRKNIFRKEEISVTDLPQGIYYVVANFNNKRAVEKFIKK